MKIKGTEKDIREFFEDRLKHYENLKENYTNKSYVTDDFIKELLQDNELVEIENSKRFFPTEEQPYYYVVVYDEPYEYVWETRRFSKGIKDDTIKCSYEDNLLFATAEEAEECCHVLNTIDEYKMSRDEIDKAIEDNYYHDVVYGIYCSIINEHEIYIDAISEWISGSEDLFKSYEIAEKVVEECGEDNLKKYYFGIQ